MFNEIKEFIEEEYQKGTIINYKYDRISNTLSIQMFPDHKNCEININLTTKDLENG